MKNNFFTASEIAEKVIEAGQNKANLSVMRQLLLGFLAGAELFTGNYLMIMAAVERRITFLKMPRTWFVVYLGNFIGGVFIAVLINYSGQLSFSGGLLGGVTIKTAAAKINMPFSNAFIMGILCNWLVCTAIWISFGAKDGAGRILGIFFPIWLFVASGFEHSIANMYYIPAGILAKCNSIFVSKAIEIGTKSEVLDKLNWCSMFTENLIPVTLGNILGGAVFVGFIYWLVYRKATQK